MSSAPTPALESPRYAWLRPGDVNAFFGVMLDNIGGMILMAGLLVGAYGFPAEFVLTRMIPGTAVGVTVGDLLYTIMAFRLARRTGRHDITAMPLGLDTPSIFGTVFLVLGPAFRIATKSGVSPEVAAEHAWYLGITMLFASGVFKLVCSVFSGWIRRIVPRAGLLGSLTAIALVIISFLPLLEIASQPIAGFVSLALILATLTARWELPKAVPGTLAAVVVGGVVYYGLYLVGLGPGFMGERPSVNLSPVLPIPAQSWWTWFQANWSEALTYLTVAIPLALATVVGGIDCTESAAAAGDEFRTGSIIAVEGLATLAGGLFGGVIQTTPYIGHPAFKAMGARAGYTLFTALFVGAAGVFGFFGWIFYLVPKAVILPILVFVGLEITAQSFRETEKRHYPALALSCVPALAYLAYLIMDQLFGAAGKPFQDYTPEIQHWIQTLTVLAQGFIITSLLWGMALAKLMDGKARQSAATFLVAGAFSLFGIIHSPIAGSPILWPWKAVQRLREDGRYSASAMLTPYHFAAAYALVAATLVALGHFGTRSKSDEGEAAA